MTTEATTETEPVDPLTSWLKPFKVRVWVSEDGLRTELVVTCRKCSSNDVIFEWHPMVSSEHPCWPATTQLSADLGLTDEQHAQLQQTEHLCRSCLSCGYAWCERTADAR
jgi:hypothetical protein